MAAAQISTQQVALLFLPPQQGPATGWLLHLPVPVPQPQVNPQVEWASLSDVPR